MFKKLSLLSFFIFNFSLGEVLATGNQLQADTPNNPAFFRCNINSKTFYLLGTSHNKPYDSLCEPVRTQIAQLSHLITERTDYNDPFDTTYPWYNFLTGSKSDEKMLDLQEICQFLSDHDCFLSEGGSPWLQKQENSQLHEKLKTLGANLPLCCALKVSGLEAYLECAFFQSMEDEDHISVYEGMDMIILNMPNFSGNIIGLESSFEAYSLMNAYRKPSEILDRINALIDEYLEYLQSGLLCNDDSSNGDCEYQSGDLNALEKDFHTDGGRFVGAVARNYLWLPRLLKAIHATPDNSTLVTVGRGHLISPHGLLPLLQTNGAEIEHMNSNGDYAELSYIPLELPESLNKLINEAVENERSRP